MNKRAYSVAGFLFLIDDNMGVTTNIMSQYAPFLVNQDNGSPLLFSVRMVKDVFEPSIDNLKKEIKREEGDFLIRTCYYNDGKVYCEFHYKGKRSASFLVDEDYTYAELKLEDYKLYGLNNTIRTLYTYAALKHQAILFHASSVCHKGMAYLFLGKSGTGKSTHSSLWLSHIPDTELINDDVPVVRLINDEFIVYGSPWSGKTPCYRNVSYPLGGIARIYQAPLNRINQLGVLESYATIEPSIQGDRTEKWVADNVHNIETLMIQKIRIWSMECLPDENAAKVCCNAMTIDE